MTRLAGPEAAARRRPAPLTYLGIAGMFCVMVGAGIVACAFQAASHLLLRPLSRAAHRRVTVAFSRAFLLCGTVVLERWGRIRIVTHGDPIPPHSATLCILNHCTSVDMLIGLAWLARYGPPYPGNAKAIVKASLGKVPIFGWILRFAEFPRISRSWEQDRVRLIRDIRSLATFPIPLWYVIYPEGSRIDPAKLRASQDYSREKGYPVLEHVLLPRFKAFTAVAQTLRGSVEDICDATLMFEGPIPTAKTALSGECSTIIHAYTTRHKLSDIPEDEEGMEKWLLQRWIEKDRMIAKFKRDPSSIGPPREDLFPRRGARPSIFPFAALFATFIFDAAAILYLSYNNKVLLRTILITPPILLVAAGIVFYINLLPSSKGLAKAKPVEPENTAKSD